MLASVDNVLNGLFFIMCKIKLRDKQSSVYRQHTAKNAEPSTILVKLHSEPDYSLLKNKW